MTLYNLVIGTDYLLDCFTGIFANPENHNLDKDCAIL